jgi:hypothetical protein
MLSYIITGSGNSDADIFWGPLFCPSPMDIVGYMDGWMDEWMDGGWLTD